MSLPLSVKQIKVILENYQQEHLLQYYDTLSDDQKQILLNQIERIDFEQVTNLYHQLSNGQMNEKSEFTLAPLKADKLKEFTKEARANYQETGWEQLKEGKVAALVVAGGQGSRLGHNGPKGTLNIGLPSQKSLFQLQAERLLNLSRKAGRSIPWCIMTSPSNHEETVSHFSLHNYFGYSEEDIFFFQQDVLPAVSLEGKILLESPFEICLVPNGNGGCFTALNRSGGLKFLMERGVEWLFYYNVDNALIKVADPEFVGFASWSGAPIASKVIEKRLPEEKVGLFCLKNGRPAVVEYTDIPHDAASMREDSGHLQYCNANISIHLFHMNQVKQLVDYPLPYHAARKAVKTNNHSQEAYKFELFYFDAFPLAKQVSMVMVEREEEFAPLKNKTGDDSPEVARNMTISLHRQWLQQAGIPDKSIGDRTIEISPMTSYGGEGLSGLEMSDGDPLII